MTQSKHIPGWQPDAEVHATLNTRHTGLKRQHNAATQQTPAKPATCYATANARSHVTATALSPTKPVTTMPPHTAPANATTTLDVG